MPISNRATPRPLDVPARSPDDEELGREVDEQNQDDDVANLRHDQGQGADRHEAGAETEEDVDGSATSESNAGRDEVPRSREERGKGLGPEHRS